METIYYPDEIRSADSVPGLPRSMDVNEKELQMAELLINHLSTDFNPEKYQDEYRGRVQEAIEKKVAGEEVTVSPEAPKANVIDLMSALQASLDAVKVLDEKGKKGGPKKKKESGTASG
jgi:DNA end-binding protein Ku